MEAQLKTRRHYSHSGLRVNQYSPMLSAQKNQSHTVSSKNRIALNELESFINDNISDSRLTVDFIAKRYYMSKSSLLRFLKKNAGTTPSNYLHMCKMNHAFKLLVQGTYKSISRVSYESGFKDAKAFSRSFKKQFGVSPSDLIYRC